MDLFSQNIFCQRFFRFRTFSVSADLSLLQSTPLPIIKSLVVKTTLSICQFDLGFKRSNTLVCARYTDNTCNLCYKVTLLHVGHSHVVLSNGKDVLMDRVKNCFFFSPYIFFIGSLVTVTSKLCSMIDACEENT